MRERASPIINADGIKREMLTDPDEKQTPPTGRFDTLNATLLHCFR
ncbi:MAG TPA: hypothetical protein VFD54_17490 [Anaerolineales bacterium]|nr:hypothetical protein [Anaerolineales bacterium]